jgi:sacsin
MNKEMGLSCLFRKNIKCVEMHQIGLTGTSRLLATMTASRSDIAHSALSMVTVEITRSEVVERKEWYSLHSNPSRDEAVDILSQQPGSSRSAVTHTFRASKFSPEVKIAIDVTGVVRGRLFTYLPLPIFSGFPVHIHALFGITNSRSHLRRAPVGLVSDE